MAWTSPRTWNPGETVTASLMNTHVRDNLNFLRGPYAALVSTLGNVGTGEDDLHSFTLTGGHLDANGLSLRYLGWGKTANNANAKTLKAKIGTTELISVALPISALNDWGLGFSIQRKASTGAQLCIAQVVVGPSNGQVTMSVGNVSQPSVDLTANQTIKLTATATSDNDITQEAGEARLA